LPLQRRTIGRLVTANISLDAGTLPRTGWRASRVNATGGR
jgi:hypothetical protein